MRGWVLGLAVLAIGAAARAGEEPEYVQELRRQNAELEERLRRLEASGLEQAIDSYLHEERALHGAEGAASLLPGGMALRVSGEIRIREEVRDRNYAPADPAGAGSFDFAHMRTRLRFDVDVLENLDVVIELQDVRNLGGAGSTTAVTGGVDLKRAAIVFKEIGGNPLAVEAGRFVMFYGDQRVVGHLEWFDQGRTYDGLRARYTPEGWWIDLFAVRIRETVTPDDDQWLLGVYGGRHAVEGYLLVFGDDQPPPGLDNTRFLMVGARLHDKRGAWDYTVEAAFQGGEVFGADLAAFGVVLTGGYTFESDKDPRLGIEIAYATGDEDPADGETEQFQTLFPTNHPHYGYMDLVGWSNLLDVRLRFSILATPKVTVALDYHHFRLVEETGAWVNAGGGVIRLGAVGANNHLGDEIDVTVVWKPRKSLVFLFGYSVFLPGGFVEDTGNDPVAHFLYLQSHVRF